MQQQPAAAARGGGVYRRGGARTLRPARDGNLGMAFTIIANAPRIASGISAPPTIRATQRALLLPFPSRRSSRSLLDSLLLAFASAPDYSPTRERGSRSPPPPSLYYSRGFESRQLEGSTERELDVRRRNSGNREVKKRRSSALLLPSVTKRAILPSPSPPSDSTPLLSCACPIRCKCR